MYRFMKSSTRAFSSLVRSEYSNSMVSLPPSVGEWRCLPIGTDSLAIPSVFVASPRAGKASRSEEHTSELKSLMRISYAVFCLKKKNQDDITKTLLLTFNNNRQLN